MFANNEMVYEETVLETALTKAFLGAMYAAKEETIFMARSEGYRTKGRQLILDYLEKTKERTVSVGEIQDFMEQQGNPVNVSTIYRNLDALVAQGQVMKFVSDKGDKSTYRYIEPEHECHKHLHIQCVRCGKVIHLECDFMKSIEEHVYKDHGVTLLCNNSILYGICEECKIGTK